MRTSEQTNEIAAALAKAQGAMKNATLNKVNPHFKSRYADLAAIRDAVVPALAANGIAVVQGLADHNGGVHASTRLLHSSGQWIESICPIIGGTDMQKMGSAITYARRYLLSAICGIAADEDDDGNAASADPIEHEGPYGEWLADMGAAADEGYAALVAAVSASKEDYKRRLRADSGQWAALKARAENRA